LISASPPASVAEPSNSSVSEPVSTSRDEGGLRAEFHFIGAFGEFDRLRQRRRGSCCDGAFRFSGFTSDFERTEFEFLRGFGRTFGFTGLAGREFMGQRRRCCDRERQQRTHEHQAKPDVSHFS
jgi:hypothetical protein